MEIIFILTEPKTPENIGAAARALKTMGFGKLRLVNPCNHLDKKAKWLAVGSDDILENAELYPCFKTAIKDIDFIIGTTAKKRNIKKDYYTNEEIADIIKSKGKSVSKIAVVFGREEFGLKNKEVELCDVISSIPMKTKYPSLNLAQAVMIYACSLSKLNSKKENIKNKKAKKPEIQTMKTKVKELLEFSKISKNKNLSNRIFERLMIMRETDIHLALSVCNKILEKIKKPQIHS